MTKVIFRRWKKSTGFNPEIIAFFPEIKGNTNDYTCSSYMHIGQHGAADYKGLISQTTLAKPDEYKDLLEELVSIGYDDLKIIKKFTGIPTQ